MYPVEALNFFQASLFQFLILEIHFHKSDCWRHDKTVSLDLIFEVCKCSILNTFFVCVCIIRSSCSISSFSSEINRYIVCHCDIDPRVLNDLLEVLKEGYYE